MILHTKRNIVIFISILVFAFQAGFGQEKVITLDNPSFEDFPQHSVPPKGWTNCGFYDESPPDVQPSGAWGVFWPAMDGNTYLGMVTRENETYESVGQRMNGMLWAGTCYQISFYLCKSPVYFSGVNQRVNGERQVTPQRNFVTPIKLRIWGGNDMCTKEELLGESPLVSNTEWERFHIKLSPKNGNYRYIFLEAYYETPVLFPYNGNILVDDASDIVALNRCDDELKEEKTVDKPIVSILDPVEKINEKEMLYRLKGNVKNVEQKEKIYLAVNDYPIKNTQFNPRTGEFSAYLKLAPGRNAIKLIGSNAAGTATDSTFIRTVDPLASVNPMTEMKPAPKANPETKVVNTSSYKLATAEGKSDLRRGDVIQLSNLQFSANSSQLSDGDSEQLDDLFNFMRDYPAVEIEVAGHTNAIPDGDICLKISRERATSVARYLVERGISFKRIRAVGYGKKYPIASNDTPEGRKQNQRVEIKILELGD